MPHSHKVQAAPQMAFHCSEREEDKASSGMEQSLSTTAAVVNTDTQRQSRQLCSSGGSELPRVTLCSEGGTVYQDLP